MDASEYLAFIPLLIYGLAVADLLGEWKRLFNKEQWYLPYLLLTVIFTEVAIYNVFIYVKLVNQMVGQTYLSYLMYILPPFLFLMTVSSFTPDKDDNTKEYFQRNMPIFLTLFTVFIATHFLYNFEEGVGVIVGRIIGIIFILITGILRKVWLIYVLSLLWIILITTRFDQVTT